jgi:hypothetical protein
MLTHGEYDLGLAVARGEIVVTDEAVSAVLAALAGEPSTDEAERIVRAWRLCGGVARHSWPRAGGLEDQDAVFVFWFEQLDRFAAEAMRAQAQKEIPPSRS